ncbi:MAG: PD-(D/E)XK nuclease family protein [Alphaproteobacteria bacterium]
MSSVEAFIEKLVIESSDFADLNKSFERFCPFEATGMVRQEIRHGYFLSYILDPNRPHGFGSGCLKAFLMALARCSTGVQPIASPLEVHTSSWDEARVFREWKNIDVLIEIPSKKTVIAIELKIDAGEHGDQLSRYTKSVREKWPDWRHGFVFLTKTGEAPNDSVQNDWVSLGLCDVVDALAEFAEADEGGAAGHNQLSAYIDMTRRHHLVDEKLESLAAELWSQHREALEFLMDRRPEEGIGNVFGAVSDRREDIAKAISEGTGLRVVCDNCTSAFLRFGVIDWDEMDGMLTSDQSQSGRVMYLEAQRETNSIGVRIVLGPGTQVAREHVFEALLKSDVELNVRTLAPVWSRLLSDRIPFNDLDVHNLAQVTDSAERAITDFFSRVVSDVSEVILNSDY